MLLVHHVSSLLPEEHLDLRYHIEEHVLGPCVAWPTHCYYIAPLSIPRSSGMVVDVLGRQIGTVDFDETRQDEHSVP